jgi:MFS family permease
VNVFVTLLSVYLVERAGRRVLLLISEIICFISFLVLSVSMIFIARIQVAVVFFRVLSVASVLFFVVGFAIGFGSIPWIMLSELYPNDVRGFASSIITCLNWALTFLIALTFPLFTNWAQEFTFLPFTLFILISIVLTFFFVPETKGVSIEELTEKL